MLLRVHTHAPVCAHSRFLRVYIYAPFCLSPTALSGETQEQGRFSFCSSTDFIYNNHTQHLGKEEKLL